MELSLVQLQVDSSTAAILVADPFSADLAQLNIHLVEVVIYELST